ncbi:MULTISPECIES: hypothetical protein [Halostella]|uniref:hypothetical protein n=1 Tax=Halostella TaxID=1843185 RepID=UPI001963A4FF|nr:MULTISPECIES: hypothetical protein [Halostella]
MQPIALNSNRLLEVVPHYVALLLLVFLVLSVVRSLAGDVGFWIELLIVLVVGSLYRPVVQRLGIGPSAWGD